jgi:glycosyltransferase involved in cell wall biosynthesis
LRILQLIESFGRGGAERHVLDITSALLEAGHDCVALGQPGDLAGPPEIVPVRTRRRHLSWFPILWDALGSQQYDVIHVHSIAPLPAAAVIGRIRGVPVVFTVHGWTAEKVPLARCIFRVTRPSAIIAVSRDLAEKFAGLANVRYVPNGVPDRGVAPDDGVPDALSVVTLDNVPQIVTVGRLASPKNQRDLIIAFSIVRQTVSEAKLVLLGDGPDRAALQRLSSSLDLTESITFAGFAEPHAVLRDSAVYASSSLSEGLSLAHLEALMMGLPLVVTRTSGAEEVVSDGENGFIVPLSEPEELAAKLVSVLRGELPGAGDASRKLYESQFRHSLMTQRMIDVYREVS